MNDVNASFIQGAIEKTIFVLCDDLKTCSHREESSTGKAINTVLGPKVISRKIFISWEMIILLKKKVEAFINQTSKGEFYLSEVLKTPSSQFNLII